MRECPVCGGEVVRRGKRGTHPTYCSKRCKQTKRNAVMRARRRAGHKATHPTLQCQRCGLPHTTGNKYCSPPCRSEYVNKTCQACGAGFRARLSIPGQGRGLGKYCSDRCKCDAMVHWYRCQGCGIEYRRQSTGNHGKYCSRQCAFDNWSQWAKVKERRVYPSCKLKFSRCRYCARWLTTRPMEYRQWCDDQCYYRDRKGDPEYQCGECGRAFIAPYGSKRRRFCSDVCLKRASRREGKARRRARLKGGKCKPVNRRRVFERDAWICQICGEPIDRRRKSPHPKSGVLDHIVPLSKGGDHRERNLQAAHAKCNVNKGNKRAGSQLRLCG